MTPNKTLPLCSARRLITFVSLVCLLVLLAGAGVASAAPQLEVQAFGDTTAQPETDYKYLLAVVNTSATDTDGTPLHLAISLPAGVTAVEAGGNGFECTAADGLPVEGATDLKCLYPEVLPAPGGGISHRNPQLVVHVSSAVGRRETARFVVSGGGAPPATTVESFVTTSAPPGFGVATFDTAVDADQSRHPFVQAGGHPFAASTSFEVDTVTNPNPFIDVFQPAEPIKDVRVALPPGLVGFPTGQKCEIAQLAPTNSAPACSPSAQIGEVFVYVDGFGGIGPAYGPIPVYDLVPPSNLPAQFGFNFAGSVVTLDAHVRTDEDYGITIDSSDVSEGLNIAGTTVTLWGDPASSAHTPERDCPNEAYPFQSGIHCQSGDNPTAFLRLPTACTSAGHGLMSTITADSWTNPGVFDHASAESHLPPGFPSPPEEWGAAQGPAGCEKVPFAPTLDAKPTSSPQANSPDGLSVDLSLPQSLDPAQIGEADLKKTVVTFPAGVRLNPSSAGGLGACSEAQIGLIGTGFPEPNKIHFNTSEPTCPENSKIGTLEIETPLLEKPLTGSVYLATPHENPFGTLAALYLVANGPGTIIKLPGRVDLDPSTGQITSTFDDNPQLPFSNLHLELKDGPRAPLVMPPACGTYTTHSQLTSWSGKTVESDSSFTVSEGPGGAPCGATPFAPSFEAGTTGNQAGSYSPFVLRLGRTDADGELGSLSTVTLPPGLLANEASVTVRCTDAEATAAACPAASKIGTVTVGAGPGTSPYYVTGDAYLVERTTSGLFSGHPFGLAFIVHAVAGPFDLGYTVVKGGVQVHDDGSIVVQTEPFPQILQGIPLQLRDVRVNLDRPGFTFNPTDCEPLAFSANVVSTAGQSAALTSSFQASECATLSFKPKFSASTNGNGRINHSGASLDVKIQTSQGPAAATASREANIHKVEVQLPLALPSRLETLQRACTEHQFAADPAGCPPESNVGAAVAHTPLLKSALEGPAYLVSHGGAAFPDLVLVLQGEGITLDVTGHTQIKKGITYSRFETVPDAPITSFELKLPEGPFSALAANTPLCGRTIANRRRVARAGKKVTVTTTRHVAANLDMPTTITAQNGAVLRQVTKIAVTGCPKAAAAHARTATHTKHHKGAHR